MTAFAVFGFVVAVLGVVTCFVVLLVARVLAVRRDAEVAAIRAELRRER